MEYANFENAKKERPITSPGVDDDNWNDDVSEASDQSTIIPTPRYELSGKSSAPHYVSGGMGNKCDKKNSTKVVKRPLFGGV